MAIDAPIVCPSARVRSLEWFGLEVAGLPEVETAREAVLAADLGFVLRMARGRPETLAAFRGFLLFDSLGPDGLSQADVMYLQGLSPAVLLCPVPGDLPAYRELFRNRGPKVFGTPPALVYFPLMLEDFGPPEAAWRPGPWERFVLPGRVWRDFRLLVEVQHGLPAPVLVVTDRKRVSLRVEANLEISDLLPFRELCRRMAEALAVLVLVEPGRRAGLATCALAAALGAPTVASRVPGMEGLEDGLLLVEAGDGDALLAALRRLAKEPGLRQELAGRSLELSARLEKAAREAVAEALAELGLSRRTS